MTYARRISDFLSRYSWYFPNNNTNTNTNTTTGDDSDRPHLDIAWENFEHIGLPRCFKKERMGGSTVVNRESIGLHKMMKNGGSGGGKYDRAEPGATSKPTRLYPVWSTPLVDMGDFGIGVGLYFSALQYFAITAFLAGVINIPAMIYLNGDEYSPTDREGDLEMLMSLSAVCTEWNWHPCPSCTNDPHAISEADLAVGEASDGSPLTFIRVNDCQLSTLFGVSAYVSLLFIGVAIYSINSFQMEKAVKFDEAVQTTQDYSIKIKNPPPNAKDPSTWKKFFESKFSPSQTEVQVNAVTIVLNNTPLLKPLIKRHTLLGKLQNMLPAGISLDASNLDDAVKQCRPEPQWKTYVSRKNKKSSAEMIVEEVRGIDDKIVEMAAFGGLKFDVTSVFVTFHTEEAQRNVLEELTVPRLREGELDEFYRFGGGEEETTTTTVLRILEPDEPDSIRWSDLDETRFTKAKQQATTLFITFSIIILGLHLITWANHHGPKYTSFAIILCNLLAPHVVRKLTSYESHRNESLRTASQYLKITAFRWSITVFIPLLITNFADMLDKDSIIKNVEVLLLAECIQRPIIQLIGIGGILKRHILGPRAADQRRMNLWYAGDPYFISERYTDISKVLLLVLFYCILYPVGFFFGSLIFSIYYWVDKFLILRSWKQGPMIGTAVSKLSSHFFKLCLVAYAFAAAMFYTQFPYDNACPVEEGAEEEDLYSAYTGDIDVSHGGNSGGKETILDVGGLGGYRFCNQEIVAGRDMEMTLSDNGSQNFFAYIFRRTALVVLILVPSHILYRAWKLVVYPLFYKSYKAQGRAGKAKFLEVNQIEAYVPQAKIPGFAFPFLFCNRTNVRDTHIGWRDPQKSYEEYCLISDFKRILERGGVEMNDTQIASIFSNVEVYESSKEGQEKASS